MKVILIDSLPKVGKIGDVIDVKNGYAKNFLIPRKKAIFYSIENYKFFENKKHDFEKQNLGNLDRANKVKVLLEGKNVIIIENASDDGRLYGSVNSALIANKINEIIDNKLIDKSEVFIAKPIKEVGIFDIKLNLHNDLTIDVKLVVSRSESEAAALLNPKKRNVKADKEESDNNSSEISEDEEKPKMKKTRKKKDE